MVETLGSRYGGSSRTSGGVGALRIVCFRIHATQIATTMPRTYIPRINNAPTEINPKTFLPEKKAAIIKVYIGKRAEQLMKGAIMMVARRSFGFSIVRVAMIPGMAQAKELSNGMNALPWSPTPRIN